MADAPTTRDRLTTPTSELSPRRGLRVRPQRPVRALFGLGLVVVSMVAAVTIYTQIGDRREVLALTRTVLAGEQLADGDFRVVSISTDGSIPSVPATDRTVLVGQYAKVRMIEGSLLVLDSVQPGPLVDPARVLMSVPVPLAEIPTGLREGSRLALIVTPAGQDSGPITPMLVEATVAAVPRNLGELVGGADAAAASTEVALSIEIDPAAATIVGSAEDVTVAVLPFDATFPTQPPPVEPDPPEAPAAPREVAEPDQPGVGGSVAPTSTTVFEPPTVTAGAGG